MKPSILQTHAGEIAREIQARRFERTESGILLRRMGVAIGGAMKVRDYRDGGELSIDANLLTDEGLNHALNVILPPQGGYSPITAWYLAPFKNNYTPDGALKASNFVATAGEFTAYNGDTRPAITVPSAATAMNSESSEVILTLNGTGPHNLYGAVIVSNAAKGSGSGKLLAAVRFDNPRLAMSAADKIGLQYVLTAADAG